MPGETALTTALDANIVNVALVVALIAVIGIVALVLFGGNIVYRIIGSLTKQINVIVAQQEAQTQLTNVLSAQGNQLAMQSHHIDEALGILKSGQDLQRDNAAQTKRLGDALDQHEAKSAGYVDSIQARADERQQALADHIKDTTAKSMTDMIGATEGIVGASTQKIVDALLDGLGKIRTRIDEAQAEYRAKMESIGDQVAETQQNFIRAIVNAGEKERENKPAVGMGDGGLDGVGVSAGDSGGSTGDNGTGHSGGTDGTANGSAV